MYSIGLGAQKGIISQRESNVTGRDEVGIYKKEGWRQGEGLYHSHSAGNVKGRDEVGKYV